MKSLGDKSDEKMVVDVVVNECLKMRFIHVIKFAKNIRYCETQSATLQTIGVLRAQTFSFCMLFCTFKVIFFVSIKVLP